MAPPPQDPDSELPLIPADSENNTPDAPAIRSAPLQDSRDKSDFGCLLLLAALFVGVFALPAIFLLGGAPLVIPLILVLLISVFTPLINPAERMPSKPKWIGRIIVFLALAALLGACGWWYFSSHPELTVRE